MRTLFRSALTALMFCLVVGCASTSPPVPIALQAEAKSVGGYSAFGTLAPLGSFEWQMAPSYTRAKVLLHNAAQRFRKGEISLELATEVLNRTDAAHAALDAAVAADANHQPLLAQQKAAEAGRLILDTEALLERAP